MAADPSAVHAIRRYGNWEIVKSRNGEFGVVRVDDGTLWEAWHLYYRDWDAGEIEGKVPWTVPST